MSTPTPMFDAAARQGRLIRKELSEILRDRRTIVTLVLMPLLIYPLLGVGFTQFFRAVAPMKDPVFLVGSDDPRALQLFSRIEKQIGPKLRPADGKVPTWQLSLVDSVESALAENLIDLAISIDPENDRTIALRVTYPRKSVAGPTASLWIERLIAQANNQTLDEVLRGPNAPPGARIELRRDIRTGDGDIGDGLISLTSVIPFILILMTITGAVYPAIDLTAGERERGTLEILVAAPVPRINLLIAKYAAVVFVAVLTAVVNLTGMTATLLLNPLGHLLLGGTQLSVSTIALLFALLLLFAMFFSAVLLTITSFARSFKEAQAYLIPVMLFSLAPGAVGLIPDLTLTPGWAVTPLVNIVLLGRDLLDGKAEPGMAVLVVIATVVYAISALAFASRVFGAEGVLYNERNSWGDLFRRPLTVQTAATPSTALWSLALMIPTYFILQGILRGILTASPYASVLCATVVSALLFLGWPTLFAWHERVRWTDGFGLRASPWAAWVGAVLLGVSVWALASPLLAWLQPSPPEWLRQVSEQTVSALRGGGSDLRAMLIATLVIQAVVEELFFRGYLWEALDRRASAFWTIVLTSVLFGLAHVVMGGVLGLERLLPSTAFGLLLGVVRWRAGSVGPGILQHALHNAILGGLGQSQYASQTDSLPWTWLTAAGVVAIVGATAMTFAGRTPSPPAESGTGRD